MTVNAGIETPLSSIGMDKAQCLNLSEVELHLRHPFQTGQASRRVKPVLDLAYKHARRLGKIRSADVLHDIRIALEDWEPVRSGDAASDRLSSYEIAQLLSLFPSDVEEAVSLVPSLRRFANNDVSSVLETIASQTGGVFAASSQNASLAGLAAAASMFDSQDGMPSLGDEAYNAF